MNEEQLRIIALALVRGARLSDHMGDMWDDIYKIINLMGLDPRVLPEDDSGEIDLDALDEMGALCLWGGAIEAALEAAK